MLILLLAGAARASEPGLTPLDHVDRGQLPSVTGRETVKFTTGAGEFWVEVYAQAAPNAVQRFLELVKAGFYDNTPIFRVIPGFVAQFGINSRGEFPQWQKKLFNDDPSWFKLDRGTLAFAKAGPNVNSTQVFINFGDNSRLALKGGFTTFGKVVKGMDVVDRIQPIPDGLDQERLWKDTDGFLKESTDRPTMILKAEVVAPE
jgi:homoserine O-acetyltransferase